MRCIYAFLDGCAYTDYSWCMHTESITAAIMKDPEYSRAAMVERRRWIVALNTEGRRRYTLTKAEAVAWCEERGIPFVLAPATRPRHERVYASCGV